MTVVVVWIALLALSGVAWATGAVTWPGVLAGLVLAAALMVAPGPGPLALFVLFVVAGSVSSRLGADVKRRRGGVQQDGGRRGVEHALANGLVPALMVLAGRWGWIPGGANAGALAAMGALSAVLSDTVAGEWGAWLGGEPRSILTGRREPVGQDGAVSGAGLLAGLVAAGAAGLLAGGLDEGPFASVFLVVTGAGFAGNLVDSLLGATLQPRLGRYGNSLVNVACALAGALVPLL